MSQAIISKRMKTTAAWLLIALIGIMAIVNVPWALTRMRWRGDVVTVSTKVIEHGNSRRRWPSSTPHNVPWPAPQHWLESELFGWRYFDVRTQGSDGDWYTMQLQQLGWPWPVIELKQTWWNFDDPRLNGPQPDPPPSLMIAGLVLNPLVLGFGIWSVLVLPWLLTATIRRALRRRHGRCLDCGYLIGTSPVCTECGGPISNRESCSAPRSQAQSA